MITLFCRCRNWYLKQVAELKPLLPLRVVLSFSLEDLVRGETSACRTGAGVTYM